MWCTVPSLRVKGRLIFAPNRRLRAKIKVPDRSDHQNVKEKLSVTAGVYKGPIDSLYMPRHMADTHERCGIDMSASDGGLPPALHALTSHAQSALRTKSKLPATYTKGDRN